MLLSNREIAALFWLTALIILGLSKPAIRASVKVVLRALCQRVILIILGLAGMYVTICIRLLASIEAWTIANLKTTVLWGLGFAFISIVNVNEVEEDPAYFKKVLKETFSLIVLITFLLDTYTFSLPTELILFPIVNLIVLMHGFSENKPEHSLVNKLMGSLMAAAGLIYMGHALIEAIQNWREFATIDNARDFFAPVFLSLLFMPFLYCLHIYQVYERVFNALRWSIKEDGLRKYAQRKSIYTFGINIDFLKRWKRLISLETPKTKDDINKIFSEIKDVHAREKNPLHVDAQDGWSPYQAMKFLSSEGVVTDDYHRAHDKWMAASRPIKPGNQYSLNSILYYVEGSAHIANELTLQLNVFGASDNESAIADELLYRLVTMLLREAVSPAEADAFSSCLDKNSYQKTVNQFSISLQKDSWKNGDLINYESNFVIKCAQMKSSAQT